MLHLSNFPLGVHVLVSTPASSRVHTRRGSDYQKIRRKLISENIKVKYLIKPNRIRAIVKLLIVSEVILTDENRLRMQEQTREPARQIRQREIRERKRGREFQGVKNEAGFGPNHDFS